jgi:organic hydroperoxide reductase OsmC/OhrA
MAHPFPHSYEVALSWPGEGGVEIAADPRPRLTGGAPAEFDGRGDWWSPEHLLLSSLSLCLTTTFQAVAARSRVAVRDYRCRARALLDKTPNGLVFTEIVLEVAVEVDPGLAERVEELLRKAKTHCIVSNALKPEVRLEVQVKEA